MDSYAIRRGNDTWGTHITMKGVEALYAELKKVASKNTSVACYVNDGVYDQKILWIVGSKKRFMNGHYAAHVTKIKQSKHIPQFIKLLTLLCKVEGYAHDIGKSTPFFQEKLKGNANTKDPVRHEWLSMLVLRELRNGKQWNDAWKNAITSVSKSDYPDYSIFKKGIKGITDVIDFAVSTHHGLYQQFNMDNGRVEETKHIRNNYKEIQNVQTSLPKFQIKQSIIDDILHLEKRIQNQTFNVNEYSIRTSAILSRAMLIMADHTVSNRTILETMENELYANSIKNKGLNQTLSYHLHNVGNVASYYMYSLFNNVEGYQNISEESVENILRPTLIEKFVYQDKAVKVLQNKTNEHSSLIFNMGSTGSGKTIGNIKSLLALNPNNRVTFVQNLRSLTLQTGNSFKKDLGLCDNELTTIIGDKNVIKINKKDNDIIVDDDENKYEMDFKATSGCEMNDIPTWIKKFAELKTNRHKILAAPVLVSTIDYIIAAGDMNEQGNHVAALLRVASSDLIIDEIDGYEPTSLIAVCRVIQIAALFGRNVVCSSATLSTPSMKVIYDAYEFGINMRKELMNDDSISFNTCFLNEKLIPIIGVIPENEILKTYDSFKDNIIENINNQFRLAYIAAITTKNEDCFFNTIVEQIKNLHNTNNIQINGKCVSFGLIRVANIKFCKLLAEHLSETMGDSVKICAYHSNDMLMQRTYKEKRLDVLLKRTKGNDNILNDKETNDIVNSTNSKDVTFIVVATPVEEVGRDHDFDWAVIEPSSIQSIVQTSGRVNRHRNQIVSNPNICILEYNYKEISVKKDPKDKFCFTKPGYEGDKTHPSHSMFDLISKESVFTVDAKLRFDSVFGSYDDNAISKCIKKGYTFFFSKKCSNTSIIKTDFYNEFVLRQNNKTEEWLIRDGEYYRKTNNNADFKKSTSMLKITNRVKNDWLVLDDAQLGDLSVNYYNIEEDVGMNVSISRYNDDIIKLHHHRSFGFHIEKVED